ncbi:MAG TPA: hypothetical protein VGS80_06065 [Ktedonobacterales bacterium]|nr:hypothetical protein [Ktedonobacterales bacterium]
MSTVTETSLLCHHADLCARSAVYLCAGCGWHYCGDHFLRATFSGPELAAAPVVVATCQTCLPRVVAQQHQAGRTLRH